MRTWINTIWYHLSYGYDINTKKDGWFLNGTTLSFSTPLDTLQQMLEKLTEYIDSNQAVIKAVLPLTTSVAHYNYDSSSYPNQSYGYGYGYGVTPTVGAIVIAQQERIVSVEEYECLSKALSLRKNLPSLQQQCEKMQQIVDDDKRTDTNIKEKKKLLGGVRYCIANQEYSSYQEAEANRAKLLAQFTANQKNLDEAKAVVQSIQQELEVLESKSILPG